MNESLRIAVADDEQELRDYYREVLVALGHEVVALAKNGADLVKSCLASKPDLVITDIKMPGMDGIDAAIEISLKQPVPIILVSAYHDADLLERAAVSHVMAYLVKPIKRADLEAAIAIVRRRYDHIEILRDEAAKLRQTLQDRKTIEKAKEILMSRPDVTTPEEALAKLNQAASNTRRKLVEVARSIIDAEARKAPGRRGGA